MGVNQNILFGNVLTNEGGGYHPNLGVFIAPQSGVYVFSSSIMTSVNVEQYAAIAVNGNLVAQIYGHSDNGRHDQGSQTVVIKLNAGDEVAVQSTQSNGDVWGNQFSSFSGCLVWLQ
ncbi:hypothetical protein DPMN_057826 [Dreissena polymorpha]|uniref:C1q domain-containing protein n=2 Tax=Dreissena polymorpha TaxID=45954 RepID=A0A9D4C0W0_DREPO|nr:hypothetical protein DPMN_057826 [Dreissena polymorpha]